MRSSGCRVSSVRSLGRYLRPAWPAAVALAIMAGPVVFGDASAVQAIPAPSHPSSPIRGQAAPSAPVPTIAGPVAGTPPAAVALTGVAPAVLNAFGYQEREFFISGKANAYNFSSPAGTDGRWSVSVTPGSSARYETRIEVFTPTNPARFSGNVIVEWANVSAGFDVLPDLGYDHNTAFRDGDGYVAVSAQFVGVESAALNDPGRYGALTHPGDSYSYDIFSQAGMAIWDDSAQVLGGLRPNDLIADGESQSASRLATYVDAFAPLYNVYDGYIVHSRGAGVSALQQAPGTALVSVGPNGELAPTPEADGNIGLTAMNGPAIVRSRTDLLAPVLYFQTQTDVLAPRTAPLTTVRRLRLIRQASGCGRTLVPRTPTTAPSTSV